MRKPLMTSIALGSAFALGAASVGAENNPFSATSLEQGYQLAGAEHKAKEGKCGEARCGAKEKKSEAKCGEGACGGEMESDKSGEATDGGHMKKGDGACGGDTKKSDGKCGEGACGGQG